MPGHPVRLAIASQDQTVAAGLRRLLAGRPHRVTVVEIDGRDPVDIVLHDDRARPAAEVAPAWLPLEECADLLLDLVESSAQLGMAGHRLTEREIQVLEGIAQGLSNQQIADRAFISINSVKSYIRSAYRKIGVRNRSQAVAWGIRRGYGGSR